LRRGKEGKSGVSVFVSVFFILFGWSVLSLGEMLFCFLPRFFFTLLFCPVCCDCTLLLFVTNSYKLSQIVANCSEPIWLVDEREAQKRGEKLDE